MISVLLDNGILKNILKKTKPNLEVNFYKTWVDCLVPARRTTKLVSENPFR